MLVARASVLEASGEITVAKYGNLPYLGIDTFYGINANPVAVQTQYLQGGPRDTRQNPGYVAQAKLNIPVWNWGATRSKVKQAELKRDQARLDLTLADRTLQGNVAAAYAEARAALAKRDSLRVSEDLAGESLRLTLLRDQAGEATALEVVDAQTTLNQARNAYDDGLARYRMAIAALQTLMGTL
jgi:outer membrane protein TolC